MTAPASRSGSLQAQWNETLSNATSHLRPSANTPPWVKAIGLVEFDLQLGIVVRYLNPPLPLAVKQETEIAFLCFPDANLVEDGDSILDFIYAYNPNECDPRRTTIKRDQANQDESNSESGQEVRKGYGDDHEEMFCTALFRQKRDPSVTRGARQNAIVVLGDYPFPGIYRQLLAQLSVYLDTPGADPENFLVAAHSAISSWPLPLPNMSYSDLPFMGHTLSFITPHYLTGHSWSVSQPKCEPALRHRKVVDCAIASLVKASVYSEETLDKSLEGSIHSTLQSLSNQSRDEVKRAIERHGWTTDCQKRFSGERARELATGLLTIKFAEASITLPAKGGEFPSDTGSMIMDSTLIDQLCEEGPDRSFLMLQNETLARLEAIYQSFKEAFRAENDGENFKPATPDQRRAVFSELQLNSSLFPHITKLWKFWELMIIGAPLGIIGPNGPSVSAMALSICSLVAPLSYVGLLRPYLTINNREIDHCIKAIPQPGSIVAATNPFFVKHLTKWPHFLCVGTVDGDVQTHKTLAADSEKRAKQQFKLKNRMFCSRHYLVKTDKTHHDKWLKAPPSEGGRFVDAPPDAVSTSSASIRETFSLLTHEFLLPIKKFVCQHLEETRPFFGVADLSCSNFKRFSRTQVLDHLKSSPPTAFSRFKTVTEALEVYDKFLSSPTYASWLTKLIQQQYRIVIVEEVNSIADVFACSPSGSSRLEALDNLQWDFETALLQPLLDPPYLAKLSKLCQEAYLVRKSIVEAHGKTETQE